MSYLTIAEATMATGIPADEIKAAAARGWIRKTTTSDGFEVSEYDLLEAMCESCGGHIAKQHSKRRYRLCPACISKRISAGLKRANEARALAEPRSLVDKLRRLVPNPWKWFRQRMAA